MHERPRRPAADARPLALPQYAADGEALLFPGFRSQEMSAFVWEDKYSLGIAEVDRQHQKLFDLFNQLYDAMQQGHGGEVIDKVLTSVIDYTAYHFSFEEKLLHECGYEEEAAHHAEHVRLTEQAKALAQRLRTGHSDVTMATLQFLADWLARHILVSDKKYAEFLLAQGVH
jgi:hemerythrin